jgi:midasin
LDEAKKPGGDEEGDSKEPDIKPHANAIEMSEDMDGQLQDLAEGDKQQDSEEEGGEEQEELDKQMGDVDGDTEDKLDERLWGSEDEEEVEEVRIRQGGVYLYTKYDMVV